MKIQTKFVLHRKGVREQMLLDTVDANVTSALVDIANRVKPPGTETVVDASFGRGGRKVIRIVDNTANNAVSPHGKQAERRWKKSQLQQALSRIGGRFMKRGR